MVTSVIDARGTTNSGELNQRAAEELAGAASNRSISVVPFDVPSLQYVKDYSLGDLVSAETRAGTLIAAITEIEIGLDKERGALVVPTLGNANQNDDATA